MIPFAPWAPDAADLNTKVTKNISGVLPATNGYAPWKTFNTYSNAVAAAPLGAGFTRKKDGTRQSWTGTTTTLRKLNTSTLAWDDVSRTSGGAYACSSSDRWNFIEFGTNLIAHNINDATQYIDIEAGTNFAALSGSPPQAKFGAVVKDFVMLANISTLPQRIVWCGINNITQWTAGSNQSDVQDFPDGGPITAIVGGETGFVFQEDAVRRLTYVGSPIIFQVDKIEEKRGCRAPFSVVSVGPTVYYLSPEGFVALNVAGQSAPIGSQVLNEWFLEDVNLSAMNQIRGVSDPRKTRVFWIYRSNSATQYFDTVLCYDYGVNRWSMTRINLSEITISATAGYTLESLDALGFTLDTLPFSLDDDSLRGDVPQVGLFDTSFRLGFFSGDNQEAILETAEFETFPGRRSFVRGVRLLADASTVYARLGERSLPYSTVTYTPEAAPSSATAWVPFRADSRYHRVKCRIPEGTTWTKAIGIDVNARPSGAR